MDWLKRIEKATVAKQSPQTASGTLMTSSETIFAWTPTVQKRSFFNK